MSDYRSSLSRAARSLKEAGESLTDTPFLDASLLLAHAAGIDRTTIFIRYPDPLPREAADRFRELIERRLAGIPVGYLLGHREFWGLDFTVNDSVLIPRPDTETLVEKALELHGAMGRGKCRILDLCCGSGCVGIALASELPDASVLLTDVSLAALEVARENITRLLPEAAKNGRVTATRSDLFSDLDGSLLFDLIVTNPPYLTEDEVDGMAAQGWAEPEGALRGGTDGLNLIRSIIQDSIAFLKPGGYLLIESAASQTVEISRILEREGFRDVCISRDLAGRNRITSGGRAVKRGDNA
jgi:release factor glutamine methyltransferase